MTVAEIIQFIDNVISDCSPDAIPLFPHEEIVMVLGELKELVEGIGK